MASYKKVLIHVMMEKIKLKDSKIRILIIGDSLCLTRLKPETVELHDTWPYLLRENKEFEIIQLGIGGGTIRKLFDQSSYYEGCRPDIVIIQSGIVDCAPRALGWLETEIVSSSFFLKGIFKIFMPIKLMRRYRKLTYTKSSDYKNYIKLFINRFSKSQMIFIEILPASSEYEDFLLGISKNIEKFNSIIETETKTERSYFLRTKAIPANGIMSDFHHLNSIGHKWLSEKLLNLIKGQ